MSAGNFGGWSLIFFFGTEMPTKKKNELPVNARKKKMEKSSSPFSKIGLRQTSSVEISGLLRKVTLKQPEKYLSGLLCGGARKPLFSFFFLSYLNFSGFGGSRGSPLSQSYLLCSHQVSDAEASQGRVRAPRRQATSNFDSSSGEFLL